MTYTDLLLHPRMTMATQNKPEHMRKYLPQQRRNRGQTTTE